MAWIPYIESAPVFPALENEIEIKSNQIALMNAILIQLRLLNERIEEAFNTGINEEDIN